MTPPIASLDEGLDVDYLNKMYRSFVSEKRDLSVPHAVGAVPTAHELYAKTSLEDRLGGVGAETPSLYEHSAPRERLYTPTNATYASAPDRAA